eukprot:1161164-Pelagomonas_calceolata.AAC.2
MSLIVHCLEVPSCETLPVAEMEGLGTTHGKEVANAERCKLVRTAIVMVTKMKVYHYCAKLLALRASEDC